jgi:hypothetical protein
MCQGSERANAGVRKRVRITGEFRNEAHPSERKRRALARRHHQCLQLSIDRSIGLMPLELIELIDGWEDGKVFDVPSHL